MDTRWFGFGEGEYEMQLNRLHDLAPHYLWLADRGFVETDMSTQYKGHWHHAVHMVGPHFTIKVDFDPSGPLAYIGSEETGWNQLFWVIQLASPGTLPGLPEGFFDREAEARALEDNLDAVTDFYRHADLAELGREVKRRLNAYSHWLHNRSVP